MGIEAQRNESQMGSSPTLMSNWAVPSEVTLVTSMWTGSFAVSPGATRRHFSVAPTSASRSSGQVMVGLGRLALAAIWVAAAPLLCSPADDDRQHHLRRGERPKRSVVLVGTSKV